MVGKHLRFGRGFRVIPGNRASQGGADNRHRSADQWLYVLSGSGEAIIGKEKQQSSPRSRGKK